LLLHSKPLLLNNEFLALSFRSAFLLIFIARLDIQDIKIMNAGHEYLHTQNFIDAGHEKLMWYYYYYYYCCCCCCYYCYCYVVIIIVIVIGVSSVG